MFVSALLLAIPLVVVAQTCENYGVISTPGSCSCPPGYGGANCSTPACGGTIFQGSKRPLLSNGGEFGNITSCSCDSGWIGTGCNVCQTSGACQTSFNAVSSAQNTTISSTPGPNNTLTCNTSSRVRASSQMSCHVINPTLQALFPLNSELNIIRTLTGSLSPLPNATSFGPDNSAYAQLIYAGVEQFYCAASGCSQTLSNNDQSSDFTCPTLNCTCRTGTTFCGGIPTADLSQTIDGLAGPLEISCTSPASGQTQGSCFFKQNILQSLFGADGLSLTGCSFGECVAQSVIDDNAGGGTSEQTTTAKSLSSGVIAGLAVVGGLLLIAILFITFGCYLQRKARRQPSNLGHGGVGIEWRGISYFVPSNSFFATSKSDPQPRPILQNVSGSMKPGELMAILGPSGAGKTTLVEILAGKSKLGKVSGGIVFTDGDGTHLSRKPRIGFVDQLDILPAMLTPHEALMFAANLRLPESVPKSEKLSRVFAILNQLGLNDVANTRIGNSERRGISGGEMRRVSIGLELVGEPDILVLDEPTSGLDSVSAMKVVTMLRNVAHDPENPRVVICSIHQPSSKIYHTFDRVLLLARGNSIYNGAGGAASSEYFASRGKPCPSGYNVADHLLDIASEPPRTEETQENGAYPHTSSIEGKDGMGTHNGIASEKEDLSPSTTSGHAVYSSERRYATTFLTQLEVLSQREWVILRRDKTLFLTHIIVAAVLGVFCGGLYFKTDDTIAGFQSRVGCLFFLGALIAFSSLSALYNLVELRALFLRERAGSLYSPTAWLISRLIFDVIPLRLIPTIVVSSITYWMAGLAHDAAHFFKFLFILVLYSLAMTLFNFLLACVFRNGGVAILLSALTALYQMTYAGFFVHLGDIPPVLRWLQWFCPLKYTLEALSVNEVGSGLMIKDVLQGVPVNVSASLIMQLLFGFGVNNYYRDVLVLFAFIAGFAVGTIAVVWVNVRERR